MNKYEKYMSNRTSVLDKTTSIDDANMQKVNDVSQMAYDQLKRFDQNFSAENDPAAYYQKIKEDMISTKEVEDKTVTKNGVYELEIAEPQLMPTITHKNKEDQQSCAKITLNLHGKLIIAVYTSILLLLSVLLIYNAVSISRYNANISHVSQEIVIKEQELDALQQQLQQLVDSTSPENSNMTQGGGTSITLRPFEKNPALKYSKDKNWFDSLCEFFSGIFGG